MNIYIQLHTNHKCLLAFSKIFSLLLLFTINFPLLTYSQEPPFPTEHLQLWLRADSVELTNGKVSRWYDLSPNNYVIQQTSTTARPTIKESAINGNPALTFNGSSTYLTGGDILDLGSDSWTWIIIGKSNLNAWNRPYIAKSLYGSEVGRYSLSSKRLMYITTNNVEYNTNIPADAIHESQWHIIEWENDRSTLKNNIYVNGTLQGSASFPSYNMQNSRSFLVGAYNGSNGTTPQANYYLNGEIAEIIAFNTVDSTLRNQVYDYLYGKYIATVSLGHDIHIPYGICDTAITTAYNPDFISYQWSTGETDSVIHVNRSRRYTVTVTNSFGVTSTDDVNVYFPEHFQLQDTTICSGDTIFWNIGLDSNEYTLQWIKDGTQCTNTDNQIEIFEGGEYKCIITDSLGCSLETDTIHVGIDDYPISASFMADGICSVQTDTALCSGNTLGLATNIEETISYIWNTGATSARITLTESGEYTLTTTNYRGCRYNHQLPRLPYRKFNSCKYIGRSTRNKLQHRQSMLQRLHIICRKCLF